MTGKDIKKQRYAKGYYTVKSFAKAMGYSWSHCQHLEMGYRSIKPSQRFIERLNQLPDHDSH